MVVHLLADHLTDLPLLQPTNEPRVEEERDAECGDEGHHDPEARVPEDVDRSQVHALVDDQVLHQTEQHQ